MKNKKIDFIDKDISIPLEVQYFQLRAENEQIRSLLAQFISKSKGNKKLKELVRIGRKALLPKECGNLPEIGDFE